MHKCNKRGVEEGGSKKSINVEGGIFWEKTRSGGWKKSKKSINVKRVDFFGRGWNFSKLVSVTSRLLER